MKAVSAMLGDRQSMSADEAMHIIEEVALIHRPIAHQLQMLLGMDIATGRPLLGVGQ